MPDPKEYTDKDEWMKVCIPKLIEEGREQDQAVAICSSMWEAKSFILDTDAVKIGARHSREDQEMLQRLHDMTNMLGAFCPEPPAPAQEVITTFPLGAYDKALVWFGDAVKALGDGKIGGYLVRFSSDTDPDLTGQYFTADTDFGDAESADAADLYQHSILFNQLND